jgi:hypothetical protein
MAQSAKAEKAKAEKTRDAAPDTVKAGAHMGAHGATRLPSVDVDSYNSELEDENGFIGDAASKSAFRDLLDKWRKSLGDETPDPFGKTDSADISKKALDTVLSNGEPAAAGVVQSAIEDFAQDFAAIIRRYLKSKAWKDTQRIVIGGGFRGSRVGELMIGRTQALLNEKEAGVELVPIRNDPDEAGLIGSVHLAPAWVFQGHDAIFAVDIGGTNIRAGIVHLNLKKSRDLAKAQVWKMDLWRHGDEKNLKRDDAIGSLVGMLEKLAKAAKKEGLKTAPFIGIGCPGVIEADGSIDRGAQNLPGNWHSSRFNLPHTLHEALPRIEGHDAVILMHNDAVVQGLSEVPFMQDVTRWGVLTIGTGLGNARFTNRSSKENTSKEK